MLEPVRIIANIVRWGRKYPGKLKKWGNGRMSSKSPYGDLDAHLLADQARSFGWMNGVRLPKNTR